MSQSRRSSIPPIRIASLLVARLATWYPSERELAKQTEDKKNKMNDTTTATARDFFLVLILLLSSLCDRSYDFLLIFTMIKWIILFDVYPNRASFMLIWPRGREVAVVIIKVGRIGFVQRKTSGHFYKQKDCCSAKNWPYISRPNKPDALQVCVFLTLSKVVAKFALWVARNSRWREPNAGFRQHLIGKFAPHSPE